MDFKPGNKIVGLLHNGILVATNAGVLCLTLNAALSPNLNQSVKDLKTVTAQLDLQDEPGKQDSQTDATVDSDATSESGISMKKPKQELSYLSSCNSEATFQQVPDSHVSDSDTSSNMYKAIKDVPDVPPKRRGGWPKGRKRKPELLHLPPKAPATGYNLYLNEMRKQFKGSKLAFHEITKIIGNRWSRLSLAEKQPYLDKAEEDKKRYREELKGYRQSGSYQLYLAKKRKKRLQNNVLSESDMDATDDIDDEDNEELYCRTCDQWFHNLHNKKEHLQGRHHFKAILGGMSSNLCSDYDTDCVNTSSFSTSLDESSLDATPSVSNAPAASAAAPDAKENSSVTESIANLIQVVGRREREIKTLAIRVEEAKAAHDALFRQLCLLKDRESTLKLELGSLQNAEKGTESKVFQLWKVPSLFVTTELNPSYLETSEYLTDE